MTRRTWTPEEDAALSALIAKGEPAAAIARAIGRPESSVYSRTAILANQARPTPAKPGKQKADTKPGRAMRPCMCCRKDFLSEGSHNRLCCCCTRIQKTPFEL